LGSAPLLDVFRRYIYGFIKPKREREMEKDKTYRSCTHSFDETHFVVDDDACV